VELLFAEPISVHIFELQIRFRDGGDRYGESIADFNLDSDLAPWRHFGGSFAEKELLFHYKRKEAFQLLRFWLGRNLFSLFGTFLNCSKWNLL